LCKGEEEFLPLENDPVGEFLKSTKQGGNLAEDRVNEAAPEAGVSPKNTGAPIEASSESEASAEGIEMATQPAESRLGSPVQTDSKAEAQSGGSQMGGPIQSDAKSESPVAALATGEKKGTGDAEAEASAILSEARLEARFPAPVGQKRESSGTLLASGSQEEEKIQSALEVFKGEELALDATIALSSKEMGDMNVYSLLEESKQIAQIAKKGKKPCPK
jgi:hypothetical protein